MGTRRRQRRRLLTYLLVSLTCAKLRSKGYAKSPVGTEVQEYLSRCSKHTIPVKGAEQLLDDFPTSLRHMLLQVDHIFIISYEACQTRLPSALASIATCMVGKLIDNCAPTILVKEPHVHAMKVTFTHAVTLHLARAANYTRVAILEDDLKLHERGSFAESLTGFSNLLISEAWSIIRFGYRPYFLQRNGLEHCPRQCRCYIRKEFSGHFCELRYSGCDIRSSDFYIIHSKYFAELQDQLINVAQPNSKRIVDVYPMRSFTQQWLVIPQVSSQKTLDIPSEYQIGLGALYVKKCARPRPLPEYSMV